MVWFKEGALGIIKGVLQIVDALQQMFNTVVGIEVIHTGVNEAGDPIKVTLWDYLFAATPLNSIFNSMLILSLSIGGVFCVAAIFKNMLGWNEGGKQRSTLSIVGKFGFAIIGTVLFMVLFMVFIYLINIFLVDFYAITSPGDNHSIGDALLRMIIPEEAYLPGHNESEVHIGKTIQELLGKYEYDGTLNFIIPTGWTGGIFDGWAPNYILGVLGSLAILVVIVISIVLMIKRLFDLIILFILMPPVMATICYDDGQKFKAWRETVFSKAILAYGAIIAINLYIIICGAVASLKTPLSGANLGTTFGDSVFKILLIIGGAFAISGSHLLLSRVMGTSADEGREMGQAARTAFAMVGGNIMMQRLAFKQPGSGNFITRALGLTRNQAQMRQQVRQNAAGGAYGAAGGAYGGAGGGRLARASDYVASHGIVGTAVMGLAAILRGGGRKLGNTLGRVKGPTELEFGKTKFVNTNYDRNARRAAQQSRRAARNNRRNNQ